MNGINAIHHGLSNNIILKDLYQISLDIKNKNPKIFLRIQIVLLVLDRGFSQIQAAVKLETTPKRDGKWFNRFIAEEKQGLIDKTRSSRPREIPEDTRKLVVRFAISDPSKIDKGSITIITKILKNLTNKSGIGWKIE